MSIIKVIENVDLERENNRALKDAMLARYDSLIGHTEAHLASLKAARDRTEDEFNNRDEALRTIIEGDASNAGE